MTRGRHFTFSAHIAVEFLLGVALGAAAFVFDLDDGAMIALLAFGVAIATAAMSTSIVGHRVSVHRSWDQLLVLLLFVAGLVSAIADVGIETAVFFAAALIEAALVAVTRYIPESP
jgi:hypothetical protein